MIDNQSLALYFKGLRTPNWSSKDFGSVPIYGDTTVLNVKPRSKKAGLSVRYVRGRVFLQLDIDTADKAFQKSNKPFLLDSPNNHVEISWEFKGEYKIEWTISGRAKNGVWREVHLSSWITTGDRSSFDQGAVNIYSDLGTYLWQGITLNVPEVQVHSTVSYDKMSGEHVIWIDKDWKTKKDSRYLSVLASSRSSWSPSKKIESSSPFLDENCIQPLFGVCGSVFSRRVFDFTYLRFVRHEGKFFLKVSQDRKDLFSFQFKKDTKLNFAWERVGYNLVDVCLSSSTQPDVEFWFRQFEKNTSYDGGWSNINQGIKIGDTSHSFTKFVDGVYFERSSDSNEKKGVVSLWVDPQYCS